MGAAARPPARIRRYCATALAGLLVAVGLSVSACSAGSANCTDGTENYQGQCLPTVMVNYLECVNPLGFNSRSEVTGAGTLPQLASSTLELAYQASKLAYLKPKTAANTAANRAAVQTVRGCLTAAEQGATLSSDKTAAKQYAQQAAQDITVIAKKLPGIDVDPPTSLDCGLVDLTASAQCQVTITNTGVGALRVGKADVSGTNSRDFTAGTDCSGKSLMPDATCVLYIQFTPSAAGGRDATLLIHQNLPAPDKGTKLQLTGTGTGTAAPTASATATAGTASLTVVVGTADAVGHVTSSPTGIVCPGICTFSFTRGATVTLTATAGQGGGTTSWEGGCLSVNSDSCRIALTANTTITAQVVPAAA